MSKIIVSAGCSFARGEGLMRKQQRYADVIASQYGYTVFDVSMCGASNEHIASCGVYGVQKILQSAAPSNIVMLVGWTEQARMEYWNPKINVFRTAMTARALHPKALEKPDVQQEQALYEFIAHNMWSPAYGYYKLLHAFNYLNLFCEQRGVQVINVANLEVFKILLPPTRQKAYATDNNPSFFTQSMLTKTQQIKFDKLFLKGVSLSEMVAANNREYTISITDAHPNRKAHSIWAERIINENRDILGTQLRSS